MVHGAFILDAQGAGHAERMAGKGLLVNDKDLTPIDLFILDPKRAGHAVSMAGGRLLVNDKDLTPLAVRRVYSPQPRQ